MMFDLFGLHIKAPEFSSLPIEYVNTKPFSLANLKGNIILLDFWTYCCINCIHTLPDLAYLENAFADEPVQIIGIHSAKFDNENHIDRVASAIKRYEIHHPIILDKEHAIWDAYAIHAWPSLVLIDSEGNIKKVYQGEGHRKELERDITQLLQEGKHNNTLTPKYSVTYTLTNEKPTIYFPGKLSIKENTIAIANSNRNNILIGTITDNTIHITHTIGTGNEGHEDGSYDTASFYRPQSVLFADNILYIADTENHLIRTVNLIEKTVQTLPIAGISSPWDLAIQGNSLYIALAGSHQIGVYDITKESFQIFAGSRYENILDGPVKEAALAQPSGLAIADNTLYVADSETSSIRYIILKEPYIVRTLIGHGLFVFGLADGPLSQGLLQHPLGLTATKDTLYIADTYNSAIRSIDLTSQTIATLIKPAENAVCMIGDTACDVLSLYEPADVKLYENALIISDTNNHLIRKYDLQTKELIDFVIT